MNFYICFIKGQVTVAGRQAKPAGQVLALRYSPRSGQLPFLVPSNLLSENSMDLSNSELNQINVSKTN